LARPLMHFASGPSRTFGSGVHPDRIGVTIGALA
jgi:hypothetical protein